eukprot:gene29971-25025_t
MQMFVKTAIAAITALCAVGTHGYNCQTMTTATGNNVCYCDSGCTGSCCTGQTAFIWGANKDLASESCTSCAGSSYQDVSGSQQGTLTTLNGTVGSAPLPPSTLPPLPPDSSWMIPQNRTRRDSVQPSIKTGIASAPVARLAAADDAQKPLSPQGEKHFTGKQGLAAAAIACAATCPDDSGASLQDTNC